jgi:hypothetical protein
VSSQSIIGPVSNQLPITSVRPPRMPSTTGTTSESTIAAGLFCTAAPNATTTIRLATRSAS